MTSKQRKTLVLRRCKERLQEDLQEKQMEVNSANESNQRDSRSYKGKYNVKNKLAVLMITEIEYS